MKCRSEVKRELCVYFYLSIFKHVIYNGVCVCVCVCVYVCVCVRIFSVQECTSLYIFKKVFEN